MTHEDYMNQALTLAREAGVAASAMKGGKPCRS